VTRGGLLIAGLLLGVGACGAASLQSADGGAPDATNDAPRDRPVETEMDSGGDASDAGDPGPCLCESDLYIDLMGDGEPIRLTSGDVTELQMFIERNRSSSPVDVAPQCFAPPRPWELWSGGGYSGSYYTQACAGPGSAPPCLLLNLNSRRGTYVDRAGTSFGGSVDFSTNQNVPGLMQTVAFQYTLMLDDGRTLSGSFRVCILAIVHFA
jgi:hypothetical protein